LNALKSYGFPKNLNLNLIVLNDSASPKKYKAVIHWNSEKPGMTQSGRMGMSRILIVDDEPLITDSLSYSLKREGFEVRAVGDATVALNEVQDFQPELVVLDIMLPGMSGFEFCRRLRAYSATPVIMLTARGEEIDRVLGLEVGADDYLAKPFSFRELLARIRSILRRVQLDRQITQLQPVDLGRLSLDPVARRVFRGGQELQLSAREFDLLSILMKNAGRALSREELLTQVWGDDWIGDPRTLDVHVRWLRLKIEEDPASPQYIQTVRGYGYRFAGVEELN
jgi:DNA-binding response OmpR family regulator